MTEKTAADLIPGDTYYHQIVSLNEQDKVLTTQLKEERRGTLLNFWNWLMTNGYLEEGQAGLGVIDIYLNRYKDD